MSLLAGYGSTLQPVFNVLFLLAVAAAAWWGGIVSGSLAAIASVLLFGRIAGHTTTVFPQHFKLTAVLILLAVAALVSELARARRKTEQILVANNLLLEARVQERTQLLDEAHRRLQQNNDELLHFAYAVSHDLQEPLRGLVTGTQLLHRRIGNKLAGDEEQLLHEIVLGASRLNQLVRDLLAYTAALGEPLLETAAANLSDTVRAVTFNLREQIQAADATISCPNSPLLPISPVHLEQIVQNLISNALKYRSDRPPIIDIKSCELGEGWQLCVSDNGIGIDAELFERVFQPFSRLNRRSEATGTGLGLALCRRLVERYGGRMWLESKVGQGSSFYFTLRGSNRMTQTNERRE